METFLRKHYIGIAFALILLIGAVIALWQFTATMENRRARVVAARDRLASFEQNKKVLTEESKELQILKSKIEQLESNIVTDERIPSLLSDLELIAKSQNITFDIVSVHNDKAKADQQKKLFIDFTAEGNLANIQSLVNTILSQPFQVRFVQFSLYAVTPGGDRSIPSLVSSGSGKNTPAIVASSKWNLVAGIEITSF